MAEGPEIYNLASDLNRDIVNANVISLELTSGPYILSIDQKYVEARENVKELCKTLQSSTAIVKNVSADGRYLILEIQIERKKKSAFSYVAIAGFIKVVVEDGAASQNGKLPAMVLNTSAGQLNVYAGNNLRLIVAPGETIDDEIGENGYNVFTDEDGEGCAVLMEKISTDARPLAKILIDPQVIVGVGTVYRSEILYYAKLNPLTEGKQP